MEYFQSQLLFYFSLALALFLPGYAFLLALFGRSRLSLLEEFVLAPGAGLLVCNFLLLTLNRFGVLLTRWSVISALLFFSLLGFGIFVFRSDKEASVKTKNIASARLLSLRHQGLFLLLLLFSVFLRGTYLSNANPPGSTDLGHHMYWSKLFSQSGIISDYASRPIVEEAGRYLISAPEPISDFIVGEHLIFSAVALISGLEYIGAFPILLLFLFDIFTILLVFVLAWRLFENDSRREDIALLSLFFSGVLFAVDPPQAKFVSGGLIGNLFGNLLTLSAFYFWIIFLRLRDSRLFFCALFFSMGIFYTHHLSGLIFLFVLLAFFLFFLFFGSQERREFFVAWKKWLFSFYLAGFVLLAAFLLAVYVPSYLTNRAVETVVREVTKSDHVGLEFSKFKGIVGEGRLAFGFLGACFLLALAFWGKQKYPFRLATSLLLAWIGMITLISLAPDLVGLDIPASRVANYGTYPLAIISAFSLVFVFSRLPQNSARVLSWSFGLVLTYLFINGQSGYGTFLEESRQSNRAGSTYAAAVYLAEKMDEEDSLVKDHVNLAADSWVKLFFMRDYNFPVYRANLERYENGIDKKEFCTLWMISEPESARAEKCFQELGINFVMVDKKTDAAQFEKLKKYWRVFSNEEVNIYYHKHE